MQAVILAAGRGTRMNNLTKTIPKPLLNLRGKNLLEHKIDALPHEIVEVVMVVGYLGNMIRNYFGKSYKGKIITYVDQKYLNGTGPALVEAKDILKDRFLVMNGDDIYGLEDIKNVIQHKWSILAHQVGASGKGAKIVKNDSDGTISEIIENANVQPGDFVNAGLYSLGKDIFNYRIVPISNDEFGLPQMVALASRDFGIKIIPSTDWIQITKSEDLTN